MNKLTNVAFVDNSGSRYGQVIHVYANNKKHVAYSLVLVAIKRVIPNNLKKLKKGDKLKAVVVGFKERTNRVYGATVFFTDVNRAILLKKGEDTPFGNTRFCKG